MSQTKPVLLTGVDSCTAMLCCVPAAAHRTSLADSQLYCTHTAASQRERIENGTAEWPNLLQKQERLRYRWDIYKRHL